MPAAAQYYVAGANTLSNGGEELSLVDAGGTDIKRFTDSDDSPWPTAADGAGPTLVLVAPALNPDHSKAANWRASTAAGGNPGAADAAAPPANPLADDNNNGLTNLLDYAVGTGGALPAWVFAGPVIEVTLSRAGNADVIPALETATGLQCWTEAAAVLVARNPDGCGGELLTYSISVPAGTGTRLFVRVRYKAP